jgi:RHS repeat-associated protein
MENLKWCFHRNQQYSVIALTNGSGAITERNAYSAYGRPTFMDASGTVLSSSADNNRYAYTGREWDSTLSLYHYRARMYEPTSGRFAERDPIGYEAHSANLFQYVRSRGLSSVDPHGLADIILVHPESPHYPTIINYPPGPAGVIVTVGHGNPLGPVVPIDVPYYDEKEKRMIYHRYTTPEEYAKLIQNHPKYVKGITVEILHCNVANGNFPCEVANILKCEVIAYPHYVRFGAVPYRYPEEWDPDGSDPQIFQPSCPWFTYWDGEKCAGIDLGVLN